MSSDEIKEPHNRTLVMIGCGVSICIGCAAILGWLLDLPRLASLGQGLIPMAPSTALLFVVYGSLMPAFRTAARNLRLRQLVLALLAGGGLISATLFTLSVQGIFLDIEHFGITAMGAVSGSPIGHMSPVTASTFLVFSLLCPVVVTASAEGALRLKAVWWCTIIIIAAYCMLLLAYLLGTPMLYGGRFIPPAATTSFAFVAMGIALAALSLPLGWPGRFSSDQDDNRSFRTLAMLFIFLAAGIISAGYVYHRHHVSERGRTPVVRHRRSQDERTAALA